VHREEGRSRRTELREVRHAESECTVEYDQRLGVVRRKCDVVEG
jgi:hypothetical protein